MALCNLTRPEQTFIVYTLVDDQSARLILIFRKFSMKEKTKNLLQNNFKYFHIRLFQRQLGEIIFQKVS